MAIRISVIALLLIVILQGYEITSLTREVRKLADIQAQEADAEMVIAKGMQQLANTQMALSTTQQTLGDTQVKLALLYRARYASNVR